MWGGGDRQKCTEHVQVKTWHGLASGRWDIIIYVHYFYVWQVAVYANRGDNQQHTGRPILSQPFTGSGYSIAITQHWGGKGRGKRRTANSCCNPQTTALKKKNYMTAVLIFVCDFSVIIDFPQAWLHQIYS